MNRFVLHALALAAGLASAGAVLAASLPAGADDDLRVASDLATLLQSARGVISAHQARINDPELGDKGLTGAAVLDEAIAAYRQTTGRDPRAVDPGSYEGRLLQAEMDAIVEVMDANQATINRKGMGFKGFIPAAFARFVTEAFERRAGAEAAMKATAPMELVRYRPSRPDAWENAVIRDHLQAADWPRGQVFSQLVGEGEAQRLRVMVPEYYAASCLSCHGSPKGELDITGYPREGASLGQLGSIISIELIPQ